MTNKELIQENKWMREKLSSLSHQLMAASVDVEAILSYRLTVAPDKISIIAARLHDMSQQLSKDGFE
jgi:hypothetical protein